MASAFRSPPDRFSTSFLGVVEKDAHFGDGLQRLARHAVEVQEAPPAARLLAEEEVAGDVHDGDKSQVLVDDFKAFGPRLAGILPADLFPLVVDRSAGRREDSGHDLDERRFAGAVVADQPQDLAGVQVQVHAAQGLDMPETLVDVRHLDNGSTGFGHVSLRWNWSRRKLLKPRLMITASIRMMPVTGM